LRNEVIIVRSQRNSYDHAIRAAGARLVEIGIPDRFSGPGVRDAETWEIAAAINARTAAVFHLAKPHSRPTIEEVVAVARRSRVPVIVDAAAELPPVAHLKRFIAAGADLVAFSGGKAMGGPQGSGVLAGRRALVAAAYLQQADLDYLPHMWRPPASLFGGGKLAGLPHNGIGRACKVGKEQIVGALVALRRFAEEPFAVRLRRWSRLTAECLEAARGLPGIAARLIEDPRRTGVPMVELAVDARAAGMTATELLRRLATGRPRIEANPTRVGDGAIILGPVCLKNGEPAIIGRRLREILSARGAAGAPRGRATRSRRP
jgi:L-seryl-tRNA(Ser) seleniumtransferase